ncbi:vasodilator-stimulated phosphoprotein-like isoform X2 [Macaca nemestrina]|uniref:vasodilator-stimulated phosphoprotein-like isoform X2 n=1 Tax=Macaca nemestrina TaxID=9545 RepID=UPI0039B8852D
MSSWSFDSVECPNWDAVLSPGPRVLLGEQKAREVPPWDQSSGGLRPGQEERAAPWTNAWLGTSPGAGADTRPPSPLQTAADPGGEKSPERQIPAGPRAEQQSRVPYPRVRRLALASSSLLPHATAPRDASPPPGQAYKAPRRPTSERTHSSEQICRGRGARFALSCTHSLLASPARPSSTSPAPKPRGSRAPGGARAGRGVGRRRPKRRSRKAKGPDL